jgi:hypothetical protein
MCVENSKNVKNLSLSDIFYPDKAVVPLKTDAVLRIFCKINRICGINR